MSAQLTFEDYDPSHPWYYQLGGPVQGVRQIREDALNSESHGALSSYVDDASNKAEPERSAALRALRESVVLELRRDISRYREVVLALHRYRSGTGPIIAPGTLNDEVFIAVSLKYSHVWNALALLGYLDQKLDQQPDLFG